MTLTADNASYLLRGKCSEVVVTGVDSTVTMRSVGYLKIRGTGNQIDAREVRTLVVTGDGGHTLGIDAVRLLQLRSSDQSVTVTGRVGRALVLGQDHVLRAPRLRKLAVRGDGNVVQISGSGQGAVIKGTRNALRAKRLNRLRIVGSHNVARVYQGTTAVEDLGTGNDVRSNRPD